MKIQEGGAQLLATDAHD